MKKKMLLALALVMLVAAGCGKNSAPPGPVGSTPSGTTGGATGGTGGTGGTGSNTQPLPGQPGQSAAPPKQEFQKVDLGPLKAGEVAKVGPLEVKVVSFTKKTKAPGLPPNTSLAFVLVLINIKNTGTVDYPINLTEHFKFANVAAKTYVMSTAATNTEKNRITGTVKAGETVEGYIGYMPTLTPGTNKMLFTHPDWGTAFWEWQS
ncbi:MAG TPA: DUF4352 domain-containing protein [Symbiobacteriaceae bacterium]|nr:DUF4352 domain-containing protein [Symbiobacteriaceae bacterium]